MINIIRHTYASVGSRMFMEGDTDASRTTKEKKLNNILKFTKMDYALKLARNITFKNADENILFSPDSVYEALKILYLGSQGENTMGVLKGLLNVPNDFSQNDLRDFFASEKWINEIQAMMVSN